MGINEQTSLIEQAKRDGVKRFVPSEFGVDHRIIKADFFKPKMHIYDVVQNANFSDGAKIHDFTPLTSSQTRSRI